MQIGGKDLQALVLDLQPRLNGLTLLKNIFWFNNVGRNG